jgi:hypothetical protein
MTEPKLAKEVRHQTQGHKWGGQLRREFDTLSRATEGMGASSLFEAIATEAVIADDGELCDSSGKPGYAWNPEAQKRKGSRNPASERVKAAGASLGRVLAGGHPDHRSYLAFLQGVYVVTTQQDYDVAQRIEMLWDQMAYDDEGLEEVPHPKRGWIRNTWNRFLAWWRSSYS